MGSITALTLGRGWSLLAFLRPTAPISTHYSYTVHGECGETERNKRKPQERAETAFSRTVEERHLLEKPLLGEPATV